MKNYDDIKDKTRPFYPDLPPMSIHDRAAQFSPFAALVGYEDAVAETQRLTEERREISEDELTELNMQLQKLQERFPDRPKIHITYFIPDKKKQGGSYHSKVGNARTIDQYNNTVIFTDGEAVKIEDMYSVVVIE